MNTANHPVGAGTNTAAATVVTPSTGAKVIQAIARMASNIQRMAQRQPHMKYVFARLWEEVPEGRTELAQITKRLQDLESQG